MAISTVPSSLATLDNVAPGQTVVLRCLLCDESGRTCAPCRLRPGMRALCRDVRPDGVRVELENGYVYDIPMSCACRIQIERCNVNAPPALAGRR